MPILHRQRDAWRLVPVIMLSASDFQRDVADAYRLGTYGCLHKPISFDALFEMVKWIKTFWLQLNEYPIE
ncbi:MAG: hypothetical protein HY078_13615 [Elusimicrobia bacterium]|nr:hypothetical protein [Elusimicrobiota bacterium]